MPSTKLRAASPVLTDQNRDGDEPKLQDEGFQALAHGQTAPKPVDGTDVDVDDDQDDEGNNEGVSVQLLRDNHDTAVQDHQYVGANAAHATLDSHHAPTTADEALMTDPFSNGDGTPWFAHLHNLESSRSPAFSFGLHFEDPNSNSTHETYDHEMSSDDGGGVSLVSPPVGEDDYHLNVLAPSLQPLHHDPSLPPPQQQQQQQQHGPYANVPGMEPGGTGGFFAGYNSNPVVVSPGLPFGFVQGGVGIEVYPPDTWDDADESSIELSPSPVVPEDLPPTELDEEDHPPLMPSSTNSMILGSENLGLVDFLRFWAERGRYDSTRTPMPDIRSIRAQANASIKAVEYQDLLGDRCDFQGLDWTGMGITRADARIRRRVTYKNYVNREGSDRWEANRLDRWIPSTESYFRFRKMTMRSDVSLAHFQLRSVLACPSRSQVYYPSLRGVNKFNPISNKTELALGLGDFPDMGRRITTLDANSEVLVGGTFKGDFVAKSLYSEDTKRFSEGLITGIPGITNHLQVHTQRRSSSPVAAISSNDRGFRILDIQTEQFTADFLYHFALNCSAISPDRRLRVLVGDLKDVTITNAETGETEVELTGHRDYGFACDWSEDGRTVATAFQDKSIKIWDARKWTDTRGRGTPVASIWCDMAGARNLKFSPLGSGPPVLVAAEEADTVNVIDARTFQKKQSIELFGEIGGVAFTNDGQELNVLVSDSHRGGLLQFERCGLSNGGGRLPTVIEHMPPF